jgi:plastocyanin
MYGKHSFWRILFLSVVCIGWLFPRAYAANVPVSVNDNFFNPANVTINVNDQVTWTWNGIFTHTSTGPGTPPLWDSGFKSSGTFSRVFPTAGNFAYRCTLHLGMNGSVQVGPAPPTVLITSPANNAVFIAPATFTITATASRPGGSIGQVEFFRGATSLGVDTASPYSGGATNLAAGTYTISAVATDNLGATATNSISVIINARPTVTVNNPTNGAIFAAPATVALEASATDVDGTITQVRFLTNSASLLVDPTSPYQATAANLPAGTYNISAIATDNRSATSTSTVATITVVNPVAVVLSGSRHMGATQFQFRYTANPGLRYIVESSPILTNWSRLTTNTASTGSESFTGTITPNRNFYRVLRLPNP